MPTDPTLELAETGFQPILEWLALPHQTTGLEDAADLRQQLRTLRDTPVPPTARLKLLDLLYEHAARITLAQLPKLHEVALPVPRKVRKLVRTVQGFLELLARDYLGTVTEAFGPEPGIVEHLPLPCLRRAMQCFSWHLTVGHLMAAPASNGIWQQFHATFQTARKLATDPLLTGKEGIEHIYLSSLLVAVAQPASFTSRELQFIGQYIDRFAGAAELSESLSNWQEGTFWIDPVRDAPAQALSRRSPPPETGVLYFACDHLANGATDHLTRLEGGQSAAELGLPTFADTPAGHGVLRRLSRLWGSPAKRKFPRRRQSYRAQMCVGLGHVWDLLDGRGESPIFSEWMITNESPDGYAMMHVQGNTEELRVGDVVALRPRFDENCAENDWQTCIVRWALSENPEHIEVGLQMLSPRAAPALLFLPRNAGGKERTRTLLFPALPPMRPTQAIVVPTGILSHPPQEMIVLVEQHNIAIHELRTAQLEEQTASIEVFSVESADLG